MKDFLNRYMASNKALQRNSKTELQSIFTDTTTSIQEALGTDALRPERAINAAFADALMTGVATAISNGNRPNPAKLVAARAGLLQDKDFIAAITTGTSQKPKVDPRISRAIRMINT